LYIQGYNSYDPDNVAYSLQYSWSCVPDYPYCPTYSTSAWYLFYEDGSGPVLPRVYQITLTVSDTYGRSSETDITVMFLSAPAPNVRVVTPYLSVFNGIMQDSSSVPVVPAGVDVRIGTSFDASPLLTPPSDPASAALWRYSYVWTVLDVQNAAIFSNNPNARPRPSSPDPPFIST